MAALRKVLIAPVASIGWPSAIPAPCGLARAGSNCNSRATAHACATKAWFASMTSIAVTASPVRTRSVALSVPRQMRRSYVDSCPRYSPGRTMMRRYHARLPVRGSWRSPRNAYPSRACSRRSKNAYSAVRPRSPATCLRSRYFWILPVTVIGKVSTNRIYRGIL
jgi:hypothetical protein